MMNPLRSLASTALMAVVLSSAAVAQTAPADPLKLSFDGTIEPRQRVLLANQVNGVVSKILPSAGQHVQAGQQVFEIDPEPFEIDVATARAELDEARAKLRLSEDVSGRQDELASRGVSAKARAAQARFELEGAQATVAKQESALARAQLALSRTRILAPISGVFGKPRVSVGAYVEAEGGTVLGEIAQLDPVLVSYQVPYADRQSALAKSGATAASNMFPHVELTLEMPDGSAYAHKGRPVFESAAIDGTTGKLTTWAEFPNPCGVLVPGLSVRVLSTIHDRPQPPETSK